MRLLVFGLSGQIGVALQRPLEASSHAVVAVSRQPQVASDVVQWRQGHFDAVPIDEADRFDAIVSLGPLDHFARWYAHAPVSAPRIVAIGSTSVHVKLASPDPHERAVAARLASAEALLSRTALERNAAWFLLRPTLVWGNGRDRSLSRVASLARRWPWVPIPARASGLRQPVHVADLANGVLAALTADARLAGSYDLPGGEALSLTEMLHRTVVAMPGGRSFPVPNAVFRAGVALAGLGHTGLLARLNDDLVFDPAPAKAALGWQPRGFEPRRGELGG